LKKKSWLFLLVLIMVAFVLISGGCGGGGDGTPAPDENETPESGWDHEAYYEPLLLTQEEVDKVLENGYVEGTYEELMLADGTYVKDRMEALSQREIASAKEINSRKTTRNSTNNKKAIEYTTLMAWKAWSLMDYFPQDDPKRTPRQHENGKTFGQSKYVYIYEQYGKKDDATLYGVGACDTLEDGVGKQRERDVLSNSCEDGMYGMDCVGFVFECARAAGIPMTITAPESGKLGNPAVWNNWLKNSVDPKMKLEDWLKNAPVIVERVSTAGEPLPGDILIWDGKHVGIAGKLMNSTIIMHSTGMDKLIYTCNEYESVAEGHRLDPKTLKPIVVSGPQYTLYSAYYKKEDYRLRIKDKTMLPVLDGWWKPIGYFGIENGTVHTTIDNVSSEMRFTFTDNEDGTYSLTQDGYISAGGISINTYVASYTMNDYAMDGVWDHYVEIGSFRFEFFESGEMNFIARFDYDDDGVSYIEITFERIADRNAQYQRSQNMSQNFSSPSSRK
jgi:hypothetical protein